MSKMGKVLVAMSGGIDSTVTAILLHDLGYEVIGITMKTWDYAQSGGSKKETGCCSLDAINDARQVAVDMGFHHFILDIRDEFGDYVIDNFVDEYMAGRTPNPCVLCNTHIKWNALLKRASALDCETIATGHYAKILKNEHRYHIAKSKDLLKDQSYVLWGLTQKALAMSQFTLGNMTKPEVRQLAHDAGYTDLAKKAESYEICFVPDNDYRGFLRRKVDGLDERVNNGHFVDRYGNIMGNHEGYPFFTIGQRKGLGVAFGQPMYVSEIRPESNEVVLGPVEELIRNGLKVSGANLQKYEVLPPHLEVTTKVRYKDAGTLGVLNPVDEQMLGVEFLAPVQGIAPGQSAVFYEGDDVVGGGIIHSSYLPKNDSFND
jgi:tRNA-specific 2-thiouridylase